MNQHHTTRRRTVRVRSAVTGAVVGAVLGVPTAFALDAGVDAWQDRSQAAEWAEQCERDGGDMVTVPKPGGGRSGPLCWGGTPPVVEDAR